MKADLGSPADAVQNILAKAVEGSAIRPEEALQLMKARSTEDLLAMFHAASEVRRRHFGDQIFAYGFLYFSTYCRNSCIFCFYRKPNPNPPRYRMNLESILQSAETLRNSGVHLIDLTMGEDPLIHDGKRYDLLLEMVKRLKKEQDMPLMISPGVLPPSILHEMAEAGVDWYSLYQETHNRHLFSSLRLSQDYDERMKAKLRAKSEGMLIEEGILIGVGENQTDVVSSVFAMKKIAAHQVRAMGFIPQPGTPMEKQLSPPIIDEMKAIALMRLVHPDRLIPASYDIDGVKGLELRLMAGANVVTSLIPPSFGLVGVAQSNLDIENNLRTLQGVKPYIKRLGLKIASPSTCREWVEHEKQLLQESAPK